MIDNFFYLKCAINLNDKFRIICRKTQIYHLNITILHKFLCTITKRSTKNLFLHKNLRRTKIKISTSPQI